MRRGSAARVTLAYAGLVPFLLFLLFPFYWMVITSLKSNQELYDLQQDPLEGNNLIFSGEHQKLIAQMRTRLFDLLRETGGLNMPLWPDSAISYTSEKRSVFCDLYPRRTQHNG